MTKYRAIPFLFWFLLGILAMLFSNRLDMGTFHKPGPGLVPFLLGLLLSVSSLYPLVTYFIKKVEADKSEKVQGPAQYRKIVFVLLSLLLYSFIFESLGFVVSTVIFLVCVFRGMGNPWRSVLIGSAVTTAATYFLFALLGVRFPPGLW
jgi:putative tricarboxylic transport membrane protein